MTGARPARLGDRLKYVTSLHDTHVDSNTTSTRYAEPYAQTFRDVLASGTSGVHAKGAADLSQPQLEYIRQILDMKLAECIPVLEHIIVSNIMAKMRGDLDQPSQASRDAELWPAEAGLLRKALDIPPRDNRTERTIAESLSSIPSVKSVAILAKETDEWHLAIIHDDDDIKHALDQIIDKIIEIEDMPSVPLLGTQLIHVSEAEPEDTKGAKVILQR